MKRKLHYPINLLNLKIDPGFYMRNLFSFVLALFIASTGMVQAASDKINAELLNTTEVVSSTSSLSEIDDPNIINTYNITNGTTPGLPCFGTAGTGVVFQKNAGPGNHVIWRAGNQLMLYEYDNGTAKVMGTVIDPNGRVGDVEINMYDKINHISQHHPAGCYIDGVTNVQSVYQQFSGTITVEGVAYTVEKQDPMHDYIVADGAGFEPGRFGVGAWTSGTFGTETEWFGNLEPVAVCDLTVDAGEDIDNCNNETVTLMAIAANESTCTEITSSYTIVDSQTEAGCFYSSTPGVIFQKYDNCNGIEYVWRAGDDLILNEYADNTAKITGSLIDQNGRVGYLNVNLYDKANSGTTWSASCYLDGISGPETYYQSFSGALTVEGVPMNIGTRFGAHFILAQGAGFDSSQYGLGAWTGGGLGECTEWFGNLVPRTIDNPNSGVEYLWSTGETTQSITVTESGEYTVTVTDCAGCTAVDTVVVRIGEANADAGVDQNICKGDEITLTVEGEGTYLWSTGETTQSITVNPMNTSEYGVTVTNGHCEASDSVAVNVGDAQANAGDDKDICKGDEVTLTVVGEGTYLWSTGETTQSITVDPMSTTEYGVTITNGNCEASDSVIVNVGDATANAGDDKEICKGEETILTVTGEGTYLWSTGETTQSITVSPMATTEYSVAVTNAHCEATDTVKVVVGEALANAGDDVIVCHSDSATLTVTGEGTYLWSTGETTQSITVSPDSTTEYSVTVTNGHCVATDTVMVTVDDKVIIGDFVWLDENDNGLQDDGANGINGVTVTLFHCNGDEVAMTTTADNGSGEAGAYNFEVCPNSGSYYVVFGDVPAELEFTASNAGDDALDSDADTNGRTDCFSITDVNDLTIDAGLNEICVITVDAGDDVEMCRGEVIEITAMVDDSTDECPGGCVYPILDQDRCYGPTGNFEIYLVSTGSVENFKFKASEQRFERLEDNSARYTATATNGNDIIVVDVMFTGYSTSAPMGSPKANACQDYDTSDWEYWTTWSGTITSQNHGVFNVRVKDAAFQMGVGADVTRTGLGASGWFYVDGGDGHYTTGDVNITVEECIEEGISFEWSTEDGNIVGDANQKTIRVNQPGTYTVNVTNCIDCTATDTIVVTEGLCTIVAKRGNTPKMAVVYPVPVQSGGVLTIEFDMNKDSSNDGPQAVSLKAKVDHPQRKEDVGIMLYDITGRMVSIPRTFKIVDGKAIIHLDLGYLSPGKYILRAQGTTWSDSKNILVK